jgi:cytochrome c oxidase subunit 4
MTHPTKATSHEITPDTHHAHHTHVMSVQMLLAVFAALVALTILTVVASHFPFGAWEVWVSLGIASVKAVLVAAYFMHLRYDRPFNGLVFISSLLFVALFLAFTLMDLQRAGTP